MSDYEYDAGASRLVISEGLECRDDTHLVMVSAEHLEGGTITVPVRDEEAPAVALAILEAAGLAPYEVGCTADRFFAHEAVNKLRDAVRSRKDQAEREAEDAKVRDYYNRALPRTLQRAAWDELSPEAHEFYRESYRAAREFFAKEGTTAPRVLQYGDPEPEAGTWRSNNGVLYQKDAGRWLTVSGCYSVLWSNFAASAFPMTEVTGDASR